MTRQDDIKELSDRLQWLDEERRKSSRKLSELDQKINLQQEEIAGRERRIKELERELSSVKSQLTTIPQFDTKLTQLKDELIHLINQYDQRRVRGQEEADRLRRIEQDITKRDLNDILKQLPAINRLENEIPLRVAEENRLANLIGIEKNKLSNLESRVETWSRDLGYLDESNKQNSRYVTDIQTNLLEISKRWEPIYTKQDTIAHSLTKLETSFNEIESIYETVNKQIKEVKESVQLGEHTRNQRLENWQRLLDEHENNMKRYDTQWGKYVEQHQNAKMVLQSLEDWQRQTETAQRENTELIKIELNRLQARWNNFTQEQGKRAKTFEVDTEQRLASMQRQEKNWQAQFDHIDQTLKTLDDELDTLNRIQNAQSDAIKQIPLIWLESIQKAVAQDPNRRRQPALIPTPEFTDLNE